MRRALALLLGFIALTSALATGCASQSLRKDVDPAVVRTAAETFLRRARWKDFEGAANLLVPERRSSFLAAREEAHDERDLTVSDYEIVELRIDPDGQRAEVVSHLSWLRLPSLSEHTETVVTELVPQNGAWLIARQNKGPFEDLKPPYEPETAAPK